MWLTASVYNSYVCCCAVVRFVFSIRQESNRVESIYKTRERINYALKPCIERERLLSFFICCGVSRYRGPIPPENPIEMIHEK